MEKAVPRDVFFHLGESGLVKGTVISESKIDKPVLVPSFEEGEDRADDRFVTHVSEVRISAVEHQDCAYQSGQVIYLDSAGLFDINEDIHYGKEN